MPTAHVYCRVSSQKQAEMLSPQAQKEKGEKYANLKFDGMQVETYLDPAVSGSMPLFQRPDGMRMFQNIQAGDHVIVAFYDRGFRSSRDLVLSMPQFEERGVTLHILDMGIDTSTPFGRMFIGIMAFIKQYELENLKERMALVFDYKREHKMVLGGDRPVGYQRVGTKWAPGKRSTMRLIPWPEERELAIYAAYLREYERLSLRAIAMRLFKEGRVRTPRCSLVESLLKAATAGFPDQYGDLHPCELSSGAVA